MGHMRLHKQLCFLEAKLVPEARALPISYCRVESLDFLALHIFDPLDP